MRRYSTKRRSSTKVFILSTIVIAAVFMVANHLLKQRGDTVIAEVGGEKIFKSDVDKKLLEVFEGYDRNVKAPEINSLPKEVLEILAKEIYFEKELDKLAKKAKSSHSKETKEKIKESKAKIIRQAYIDSLLAEEVNEQVVKERYVELTNNIEGKKEYRISHIVVRDKNEAEKFVQELKAKSVKFGDLARKYSIDKDSAENEGDLGYVLEDNMMREIFEGISNLKAGEISAPIHTRFGWHVVKMAEIRDARILPFESIKDAIRNQLLQDKIGEINSRITKDVTVKILVDTLKDDSKPVEVEASEGSSKEEVKEEPKKESKIDEKTSQEDSE